MCSSVCMFCRCMVVFVVGMVVVRCLSSLFLWMMWFSSLCGVSWCVCLV